MKTVFIVSLLFCMMLIASIAWSDIIHVPGDQPTIQAGIDAASNGDTVLVADGTYTGSGNKNLDFKGKAITVTSENGAENCIIDCESNGRGFYFHPSDTSEAVVDGFTIRNGYTTSDGSGIYCIASSPTITNNIITGNTTAASGGGIYCNNSSAIISNNTITGNSVSVGGTDGGGIWCHDSSATIINNIIANNSAAATGGGIYCSNSSPTITNNTITGNSASDGGGISCLVSSLTITNTILWGNSPQEIYFFASGNPNTVTISYSDVKGGWPGEGNIDADPLFIDPDNGDYHLQAGSPCIDAGTSIGAPPDDLDGNPRDAFPDMGAYEYQHAPDSIEIISPADGDEFFVDDIVDVIAEVRDRSGSPLEGVEVTFEAIGGTVDPVTVFTDANGQAITKLTVAEGENIVAAIVSDDIFDTVTVIGLVPLGSINGNVMDTVGRPVQFAFIIAINADTKDRYKTFTDSTGDYDIPDVLSGICWVICIKKGYKAGIKKAEVVAGGSTQVDFMLRPKLE